MPNALVYLRLGAVPLVDQLVHGGVASGWRVQYRRAEVFGPDQVEQADLVITRGAKAAAAQVLQAYQARGVPTFVSEWPPLRDLPDAGGAWLGLYVGWTGRFWDHDVDETRLAALPLPVAPQRDPNPPQRRPVALVLGQVPGDSALDSLPPANGRGSGSYQGWLAALVARLRAMGCVVLWRPHPKAPATAGWVQGDAPCEGELEEALALCSFAVTWNSSSQFTAYRLGVPCAVLQEGDAPEAWREQTPATRQQRLARAAWCTFSAQECHDGTAWNVLVHGPTRAPATAPVAVAAPVVDRAPDLDLDTAVALLPGGPQPGRRAWRS